MTSLLLGPLLRYADESSATIWVETSARCQVKVHDHVASTFSVHGRHYALVVLEGLTPGNTIEYDVELDNVVVWPEADSGLPPSVIRTPRAGDDVSILMGSCRAAAPHHAPYNLELAFDADGRGVDTLWAHAHRMSIEPIDEWPHLLLLLGDQIYADDSSPMAKERIAARRIEPSTSDLSPEMVQRFEEYCWLYHEAWSKPWERWLLSTVASAMIFDDHDMIDDWNISASWVHDIHQESWWEQHAIDGLMSYWIYQHLGNMSPKEIRRSGLLERLSAVDDGTDLLREWAHRVKAVTPQRGGDRFSHVRKVGDVTVVVIDCRNARVLDDRTRLMVGPDEWAWVCRQAENADGHLILGTSVPVYIADGLHDLQLWNERVCAGAWGKIAARYGEKLRRALDLEDWSAFAESYARFGELVDRLRAKPGGPKSVVVASGDIHFSYAARIPSGAVAGGAVEVWQVVGSPIRNALIPPERGVMRGTLTKSGARVGNLLRRLVKSPETRPGIQVEAGPFFANNMCELHYRADSVELSIEQSVIEDDAAVLNEIASVTLYEPPAT